MSNASRKAMANRNGSSRTNDSPPLPPLAFAGGPFACVVLGPAVHSSSGVEGDELPSAAARCDAVADVVGDGSIIGVECGDEVLDLSGGGSSPRRCAGPPIV